MVSLRKSFPDGFPKIIIIPITEAEIICTITSLWNENSSGCNKLSNRILKICGHYISRPLAYIFSMSLILGICSEHLKYSIIKLLFKKCERSQISTN